jgi:hypothetical protein
MRREDVRQRVRYLAWRRAVRRARRAPAGRHLTASEANAAIVATLKVNDEMLDIVMKGHVAQAV